jgi:hypothetical protein
MKRRVRALGKKISAAISHSERLEQRWLLSTTSFTIVPAQSSLTVAITAKVDGFPVTVTSQGTSTLNSSQNSLTTEFTGTLLADVGTGTLQFLSGSTIAAENNGVWKPGNNPGATGNPTTSVAADFGGEASVVFETEYVAARNLVFDCSSPLLTMGSGGYTTDNELAITATQGDVYYDGISGDSGDDALTGTSSDNESGKLATLTTAGSTETLTIPISITYQDTISSTESITSVFTGTFVATATVTNITPSPTYYLRLDADGQHIDLYNNSTGTGTVMQQFLYSQQTTLTLTASTGAGSITIDNSAGDVVPTGGLTLVGNGTTALKIIGSGNGDTVSLNAGSFVYNSVAINFSGMTQTTLDPNAGTDAVAVNAGTLIIAAPATAGIKVRKFSTITIAAGAKLQVAAPSSQANRALIVASSLSIAGATGNWTGTLDLTGNDLDLPGGSLAATTNQIAQGYNAGAGGLWNGTGLISSTAGADTTHRTALGVIQNNQSGSAIYGGGSGQVPFDTTNPGASDVLVKLTYLGDTNLDGKVDGSDYSRIDNGSKTSQTGWFNGDFNYDGSINGSDYTLIDNAYNTQGASLAAQIAPAPGVSDKGNVSAKPAFLFSQLPIGSATGNSSQNWQTAPTSIAAEIFGSDANS